MWRQFKEVKKKEFIKTLKMSTLMGLGKEFDFKVSIHKQKDLSWYRQYSCKKQGHHTSATLTKEIQSLRNLFTSKFSHSSTCRNPMGGRRRRRNCGWYITWVKKIKNKINNLITAICFFMQTYFMIIHFLSHLLWVFSL